MSEPPRAIMNAAAGQKALEHHYAMCFDHLEDDFRSTSLTQLISSMIPAGQHVLDVGCGSGALSTALLQKGCRVISQDTSREMVEMCERHMERKGLQGATWLGNLDDMCEDYAFGTIVALDVLEHIEDDQHALKRMRHLVKHDGRLILSVPAISWLYGQRDAQLGHYRRYDRPQLIALVEWYYFPA